MTKSNLETEDVRIVYANEWDSYHGWQFIDSRGEEFDRWLNEIRAEAWDRAESAFEEAHNADMLEPWSHMRDNPYREPEK